MNPKTVSSTWFVFPKCCSINCSLFTSRPAIAVTATPASIARRGRAKRTRKKLRRPEWNAVDRARPIRVRRRNVFCVPYIFTHESKHQSGRLSINERPIILPKVFSGKTVRDGTTGLMHTLLWRSRYGESGHRVDIIYIPIICYIIILLEYIVYTSVATRRQFCLSWGSLYLEASEWTTDSGWHTDYW